MLFQSTKGNTTENKRNLRKRKDMINKEKERKRSLKRYTLFRQSPTARIRGLCSGKVSLCTSFNKASIAVETAFVLPLFFLGTVTMISFMDIYKIQTEHLLKLCEDTKQAGMYAYVLDGNGPEHIILPDVYTYKPVESCFPMMSVRMFNSVKVHAWTGREYEKNAQEEGKTDQEEQMVYVTETGTVYHKKLECSYLNLSVSHVSGSRIGGYRNQNGEKYSPCETCVKSQNPAGIVYITDTGNRYHNLESCSGLKRTVRLVKCSEVNGSMHVCSRCG